MEKDAVILLVGNHVPLMGSISERLEREPRFSMLGIAQTPEAALATLAQQSADAVLIDIDMRENRWPIVAKEINTVRPDISIVFLSAVMQDRLVEQALMAGVRGFLLKADLQDTLVPALTDVIAGGAYFPEEVRSRIVIGPSGFRLGLKGAGG